MSNKAKDLVKEVTRELNADYVRGYMTSLRDVRYRKVPDNFTQNTPFWRVRLDLTYDSHVHIGLDIYEAVYLGRGQDEADFVGLLAEEDAAQMGVSRQHAILRPTPTALYLVDLGSTNGTRLNGHRIGVNIPYRLHDGDGITFGHLEFVVRIIQTPDTRAATTPEDLMEIVPEIAVAITGCLERNEVLNEAMSLACAYTSADAAAVWLIDEQTGELYLESSKGMSDDSMAHHPAKQVVQTGQLMLERPTTTPMIYAPIKLGGMTFGVLSAILNTPENQFAVKDQRLIEFIAETAAVAIQNARMYGAKQAEIKRYRRIMSLLNDALNYNLKGKINNIVGYTGMLRDQLPEELYELGSDVLLNSEDTMHYLELLMDVMALSNGKSRHHNSCDLVEMTHDACDALRPLAERRGIALSVELVGHPFLIGGDNAYLYRTITGLIENGICNSPPEAMVEVHLAFYGTGVVLTITDNGASIKDDDMAHLFDKYGGGLRGTHDDERLAINLEIAYITASMHHGNLSAKNRVGGGAAFSLKLPGQPKE